MQVVFPPFVDVQATLVGVRTFGNETVTLDFTIKNKAATMHLTRQEAETLVSQLQAAGVGSPRPAITIGSVMLPKKG